MIDNKLKRRGVLLILAIGCIIMSFIDGVISPPYALKSIFKLVLFLAMPMFYVYLSKDFSLLNLFKPCLLGLKRAFLLGGAVYIIIVAGYFIFRNFFDFSNITQSLTENIGVTKDNFLYVSIYISFINSLLEEFFFRGFGFINLKRYYKRGAAYVISSVLFAIYHICMMTGWFSILAFILILVGLVLGGFIFNYLNEKDETIYSSWIVHMFANFGINTVGMLLFTR